MRSACSDTAAGNDDDDEDDDVLVLELLHCLEFCQNTVGKIGRAHV